MPEAAGTGKSRHWATHFVRHAAGFGFGIALAFVCFDRAQAEPELFERLIMVARALNRQDITSLALTLGILIFAVTTAIALVRSRARAANDQANAKREIARLRSEADRMTALLLSEPQVVVIWRGANSEPAILGDVAGISGAESARRILAFGSWLGAEPAAAMEAAVDALRQRGEAFGFALVTPRGRHIESEGRPVGGVAVLRLRDVTGAKRDHAALTVQYRQLESEIEQIKNLLEAMPAPIWIRGSEGKLIYTNRAYATAVDAATPTDATTKSIELLDQPLRAEIVRHRAEKRPFHRRVSAIVAGARRTLEVFEASTARGSAGIAFDASDADSARAEITSLNEAHRRTLDQIATAVAIFGADRRLIFYNAAYLSLFRLDAAFLDEGPDDSMVLDRLRAQRLVPETSDFRAFKSKLHEAYSAIEPRQSLWHLPDGRSFRVATSPNAQGGVTYLFDDISEGYALASKFNTLTNTQSETLDALNDAVAVFGSDGRLQLHNPAFQTMWRFDAAELMEKPHIEAVKRHNRRTDPSCAEVWNAIERAVTSGGDRKPFNEMYEDSNGQTFDCALTPLPDGGHMVSFRNISDSVRVERILRERNAALIAADSIRDTVIRYISHDLRGPLNNISGYAQFLGTPEAGPLGVKQREYLGHISASSAELLAIIDGLQLAILDAGGASVLPSEIDVRAMLNVIARDARRGLEEKHLTLKLDCAADAGSFTGDEVRVRQVLQNLMANAVSHSPTGESIGLAAERRDHAMLFRVSDRGPGIPRDVQERVFQNLETFPLDSTHRASGLGLSLVRSAMKLQGGDVMIDSEPNRGTVITCVFPLTPPETKARHKPE